MEAGNMKLKLFDFLNDHRSSRNVKFDSYREKANLHFNTEYN